jgi:hypothetical protein
VQSTDGDLVNIIPRHEALKNQVWVKILLKWLLFVVVVVFFVVVVVVVVAVVVAVAVVLRFLSSLPFIVSLCEVLPVPISQLQKYFRDGDHIKVHAGKFTGETGMIVKIADDLATATVMSDIGNKGTHVAG